MSRQMTMSERPRGRLAWSSVLFLGLGLGCGGGQVSSDEGWADAALTADSRAHRHPPEAKVTVLTSGLNNPRGLKFGPDGALYVAEGGLGGADPAPATEDCTVPPPVGPYTGSVVGSRISRIDHHGRRTTVVDGLPSSQTSDESGDLVSGVADIAFLDGAMYAILAGAGCSHGVPGTPNGVIRIHHHGGWSLVADLGAFQRAHPVAHPQPLDFEPDGTWFNMVAVHDALFPQDPGTSKVWKLTPQGHVSVVAEGFNMVLGLAFDRDGRMYVLQSSAAPAPTPGTGSVTRVDRDGSQHAVVGGLSTPTAMTFGPDGDLYISNVGFGPPSVGLGEILKVRLPRDSREHDRGDDDDDE